MAQLKEDFDRSGNTIYPPSHPLTFFCKEELTQHTPTNLTSSRDLYHILSHRRIGVHLWRGAKRKAGCGCRSGGRLDRERKVHVGSGVVVVVEAEGVAVSAFCSKRLGPI
jgi:hypothetical protein